ncbi:hypothetical protein [Yoonia sediminilitoris]|uniref:Cytochrome c domain-containing protein n=1 Tax=Yoonia sediminilitoris TaxID=1286148 RepID=A0A2T6K9N2_9RHOB|nr:hypothetical protein [Yoonia sediminilitoris]PUB11516.1 hypothetical protein C8N45_11333 [Yoonia sediminilitoris]RCW91716.1 hypothetical protein DFP92_11333 [Yoonia sediminilitoris]
MLKKILALAVLAASPVIGQEKSFTLNAPDVLADTGFLQHLLPRFSLKTSIRITRTTDAADATFGPEGTPVFKQGDVLWHLNKTDGPYTDAFEEWLLSDVGKRTIEAFVPEDSAAFSADVAVQVVAAAPQFVGDTAMGEDLSLQHCGRCHVVNETNRMKTIGSTPSFGLMRNFPDWHSRFQTFFLLRPHPAFTQITDVTDPFADNLPSPIAPIEVTLDELEAIIAYVATIPPADLGAAIRSQ